MKVRRRLARIGARLLKNSVYVLRNTDQGVEDLQWLAREIVAAGGEAVVCEAAFLDGNGDPQLVGGGPRPGRDRSGSSRAGSAAYRGRVWVTRRGVGIDRIASAWLIRRFIDRQARFKFAPATGYTPKRGELRFDMYEAEFTHEGAACTFETLLARFGLRDRGLRRMGEIVHDLDCKDDRFRRPEAAGIARLIDGIARLHAADRERLERGRVVFDTLYARLRHGH